MKRRLFSALAASIVVASMVTEAPAPAEAALPSFDGGMTFASITGPDDSEEFSWEVTLGKDQELQQIDDQHARVIYAGTGVTAWSIAAELAHDAEGADVPTSLTVLDGSIITLTVHHRAGNPAVNGAPFVYPIVAGAGWEGGFETVQVFMPAQNPLGGESESTSTPSGCVVPALVGRSLKADRKRLRKAGCTLGRVSGKRSKAAKVVMQNPQPGELRAPGSRVAVTLAQPKLAKHD